MEYVRARTRRLGSLFAFHAPSSKPDYGETLTGRGMIGLPKIGALEDVWWRWVLAAGVGAGVIPQLLLYPVIFGYVLASALISTLLGNDAGLEQSEQFGYVMGAWGLPVVHMLLVFFAASWVARRASTTPVTHGVLVALVSVVAGQVAGLLYEPLYSDEVVKYLALALAGGLLGGIESRATLAGQEALYEASRSIVEAHSPQAIANAVGDNPVSPEASGAALWWAGSPAEGEAAIPFPMTPEAWTPWFLRRWPDGLRLAGADVLAPVSYGRPALRTLRPRELPAPERAAWRQRGVRSVLILPLVAPAGDRIGLLAVTSSGRRFSRSAIRSYQTICAQAALALENLRLVEEARKAGRQAGVLRERQRMAHEIHDTLAQGFTSIVMNLEAAEGDIPPTSSHAQRHLDQARLTARESLTEARRLVWALRPEALESSASLPEALERLAGRWSEQSGIAAGVTTTGALCPLPSEVEATLFRVAQEALNNARKYAEGASRVALTLSYMGDVVALDARDDGAGFDPAREAKRVRDRESGGFGLRGMRERVEGVGGTLSVESAPGEGTTLTVELPTVACGPSSSSSSSQVEESPQDVEEVASTTDT